MKIRIALLTLIFPTVIWAQGQGGKTYDTDSIPFDDAPILNWKSKVLINGKPSYSGFLLVKAKLNGVYDISGGLQAYETFNVGRINVWGNDDSPRFWMDIHQTQVRLWSERQTKHGSFVGYLEMDGWGGEKKVRFRHVWFDYKFMHIGQDWSFFGDKDIWPNVMDWDGPPSGIWRRELQIKFYWETEKNWKYEIGAELPGAQITFIEDIDSNLASTFNSLPDVIGAIKKGGDFGHLRIAAIYRYLDYKESEVGKAVHGYGAALSGLIKTNKQRENMIQFQIAAGKGIAAYLVSFDGLGYDALSTNVSQIETVPAYGAWASYEHWFGKAWHANVVAGFSDFVTPNISEWEVVGEGSPGYGISNTKIQLDHSYLLFNVMYDPLPGLTFGVEYNLGRKDILYTGSIGTEDPLVFVPKLEMSRTAQRISFGVFFDF